MAELRERMGRVAEAGAWRRLASGVPADLLGYAHRRAFNRRSADP
jgi:hypothetical protein